MTLTNKITGTIFFFASLLIMLSGCSMNYSFTGASIPPQLKTASVQYFENRAMVVNPSLAQDLTDGLRDMLQSRTRLQLVSDIGDADFEGIIVGYTTQPVAVQAGQEQRANLERLTITVEVTYSNTADSDLNFNNARFSRYEDYDAQAGLAAVEADLVKKIISQIIEDIFNRAFVNW